MTPEIISSRLYLWPQFSGCRVKLINLSENHTYLLESNSGSRAVLRVHRVGYNDQREIESELAWMQALRADLGLFTPQPLVGANGDFVQSLRLDTAGAEQTRLAVLFSFEEGTEPQQNQSLENSFEQLGTIAAQFHSHAQNWQLPKGFKRQKWDVGSMISADGLWGDWRISPNVTPSITEVLEEAGRKIERTLGAFGQGQDRYGLIHADMRLANLLIHEGQVKVIDFDDCGFCWFGYDFAAAISFYETESNVGGLLRAWVNGYRQKRALSDEEVAFTHTFIMLRRMLLLAWIGSHAETELAQSLHPHFAQGTKDLAQRYLATGRVFD